MGTRLYRADNTACLSDFLKNILVNNFLNINNLFASVVFPEVPGSYRFYFMLA